MVIRFLKKGFSTFHEHIYESTQMKVECEQIASLFKLEIGFMSFLLKCQRIWVDPIHRIVLTIIN